MLRFCGLVANEFASNEGLCLFDSASLMVVFCESGGEAGGGLSQTRDEDLENVGLIGGTQRGSGSARS